MNPSFEEQLLRAHQENRARAFVGRDLMQDAARAGHPQAEAWREYLRWYDRLIYTVGMNRRIVTAQDLLNQTLMLLPDLEVNGAGWALPGKWSQEVEGQVAAGWPDPAGCTVRCRFLICSDNPGLWLELGNLYGRPLNRRGPCLWLDHHEGDLQRAQALFELLDIYQGPLLWTKPQELPHLKEGWLTSRQDCWL